MRPADLPPFLAQLLADHLANAGSLKCTCRNTEQPWCQAPSMFFSAPAGGISGGPTTVRGFSGLLLTAGTCPGMGNTRGQPFLFL
jgi:hypothetical protein